MRGEKNQHCKKLLSNGKIKNAYLNYIEKQALFKVYLKTSIPCMKEREETPTKTINGTKHFCTLNGTNRFYT